MGKMRLRGEGPAQGHTGSTLFGEAVAIFIEQMGKPRHRGVKRLAQGHPDTKQQNQGSNPGIWPQSFYTLAP